MAKGQLADVAAIGMHSGPIAAETAKLAESNEQIAGILDKLTEIGPYAGLITAITPLVAQIMVNHERMQPGSLGTVPPKTLEAQMKAEMAQQKLEMLRMQKMAEDQAKEFEAAMQSENGKEPSQ